MIPLFVCLVRTVDINTQGYYAYEVVECIRATSFDYQDVYNKLAQTMYNHPRHTIMLFTRPPDETPMSAHEDREEQKHFQAWGI